MADKPPDAGALHQSARTIMAMKQKSRLLAVNSEAKRKETLELSNARIEALDQKARDLASVVESTRQQTLIEANARMETLEQMARDLAQAMDSAPAELSSLGQKARELARSAETFRNETHTDSAFASTAHNLAAGCASSAPAAGAADVRAPLLALDELFRTILDSAALTEEAKADLNLVRNHAQQMGPMLEELLTLATLSRHTLARQDIDMGQLVRECLEGMPAEAEGRQLEIVLGELPACQADPELLKQVWTQLLSNALKFSRTQETARIEIGGHTQSTEKGTETVFFVKDNGVGFDMNDAQKLFGVFQRLPSGADFDGAGVGLAIVQRIVQLHGGRVWGEARVNEGSVFSFTCSRA